MSALTGLVPDAVLFTLELAARETTRFFQCITHMP